MSSQFYYHPARRSQEVRSDLEAQAIRDCEGCEAECTALDNFSKYHSR